MFKIRNPFVKSNPLPPSELPQDPLGMPQDPYPEEVNELPSMPEVELPPEDPLPAEEAAPVVDPVSTAPLPINEQPCFNQPQPPIDPEQQFTPPTPNPIQPVNININTAATPSAAKPKPIKQGMKHLPNSRLQTNKDYVHKRIAALEVLKHLKMAKTSNIVGMVMAFAIVLGSMFSQSVAMALVLIACVAFGFFLFRIIKEIQRLEYIYRLNPKVKNGSR